MTRKPRSHGRILLYRSWAIIFRCFDIILCDFDVIISPAIRQVKLSSTGPLKLCFLNSVLIWWSLKLANLASYKLIAPRSVKVLIGYTERNLIKTSIPTLVYIIIYTRPCWTLFMTSYQFSFWILRIYNYYFVRPVYMELGDPEVTRLGGVKKLTLLYNHAILQPRHPGVHFLKIIEWSLST